MEIGGGGMIDADLLRLRVLLYFYKAEENGPTVTECAKSFQTEKYTISRIVKGLSGSGYIHAGSFAHFGNRCFSHHHLAHRCVQHFEPAIHLRQFFLQLGIPDKQI